MQRHVGMHMRAQKYLHMSKCMWRVGFVCECVSVFALFICMRCVLELLEMAWVLMVHSYWQWTPS